jgi:hypothetical protein
MIKMKTIDVRLMAYSLSGKRSSGREGRREHRATDSRQRTRTKRSNRGLEGLNLSSRYFLKRSKTDIARNVKFFRHGLIAGRAIRAMPSCYQPTIRAQRYAAIRNTRGLTIVNPTAMLETKDPLNCWSAEDGARSKRKFHRPESNCGIAVISAREVFRFGSSAIGFVFMHFSQAFEDRHFTHPEISFGIH